MIRAEHSWDGYQGFLDRARASDGAYWRAGSWAIEQLRERLGNDWPERVAPERHPLALALAHLPAMPVALAECVEWAARLRIVAAADGRADLERDLQRDVTAARGLHTNLMLETAGLAGRLEWQIRVEPTIAGRPADLVIEPPGGELVVETRVLTEDQRSRSQRELIDRTAEHLTLAGAMQGVWVGGSYAPLSEGELATVDDWIVRMAPAARAGQRPSLVIGESDLTLEHRARPTLGQRSSAVMGDLWPRMETAIVGKASAMSDSGAGWLRVTLLTGIWRATTWGHGSLATKLGSLADALRASVRSNAIDGIVVSSAAGHWPGDGPMERVSTSDGIAIRRGVRPVRARETLIMPLNGSGSAEAESWAAMTDAEHDWLDWALEQRGLEPLDKLMAIDATP